MDSRCAYHPDRAAPAACAECGSPLCDECTVTVAGKPVCQRCVDAIRAKVAAEIGAVPVGASASSSSGAAAATAVREAPEAPAEPVEPSGPLTLAAIGKGLVGGILLGIVGAFVRAKFVQYTHIQFGLVDSLVGFGVGFGVLLGMQRTGAVPALMGGVLAFGAMMLGWWFLYNAEVGGKMAEIAAQMRAAGVTGFHLQAPPFIEVVKSMDAMDWVFVAIGVYGGYTTPLRARARTREA